MISQILITVAMLVGYLGVIFASELIYKNFKIDPEYTRKMSHVVASLSCVVFLLFIESHWYILYLGIFFFLLLYFGRKYKLFKSIDSVDRKTGGSYLFPLAIYLIFMLSDVFDNKIYFILPLIILGISDAIAGILGKVYAHRTKTIMIGNYSTGKTYLGSMGFLLSSLILMLIILYIYGISFPEIIWWSVLFAISLTITEAVSSKGTDNLTVPLVAAFLIWLMIN